MGKGQPVEPLECQWLSDGAWYEIDQKRTRVLRSGRDPVSGAPLGPHLLVTYVNESAEADKDFVTLDRMDMRLRIGGRSVVFGHAQCCVHMLCVLKCDSFFGVGGLVGGGKRSRG